MKKILCYIIILLIAFLSCSCQNNEISFDLSKEEIMPPEVDLMDFIPEERRSFHNIQKTVDDFDSQFSCGYKNLDGTYTLFLFSTPFRYKKGAGNLYTIDNSLTNNVKKEKQKNNYLLKNNSSDIECYFPDYLDDEHGVLLENYFYSVELGINENAQLSGAEETQNMWGKKIHAAKYRSKDYSLVSYATTSGVKFELALDKKPEKGKIDLWLRAPLNKYFIKNKEYLSFKDTEGNVEGVVRKPIVKMNTKKGGEIFTECGIKISQINSDKKAISLILDEALLSKDWDNTVTLEFSIDMYRGNMADSTVYSKRINNNQYLDNVCILGNNDEYGIGRQYTRLDIHKYIDDAPENIVSAYYGIYQLYSNNKNNLLSANQMLEFWSSAQISWSSMPMKCNEIGRYEIKKPGYCYIDITDIAKKSLLDSSYSTEINGLLLKSADETKGYQIFATNDNSVFPTFLEITFKNKPQKFYVN